MRENNGYKALVDCNRVNLEIILNDGKKQILVENQICRENKFYKEGDSPIQWITVKGGLFKYNQIAEVADFIDAINVEKNIFAKTKTVEEIELKNALNLLIKYVI